VQSTHKLNVQLLEAKTHLLEHGLGGKCGTKCLRVSRGLDEV
jgi:hypothetical protein